MIYLASASPRRRELLDQLGVAYELLHVEVDESRLPGESPETYVNRLALAKARAGWDDVAGKRLLQPVLGADTIVVCGNQIYGKPADAAQAEVMLGHLSGREHRVLSAVALVGRRVATALSLSTVRFRPLRASEIRAYIATGEPFGKAGGYAIQGQAAMFVERLEGSYSGVMGLPLFETANLLQTAGLRLL
jgi:septum formation protein